MARKKRHTARADKGSEVVADRHRRTAELGGEPSDPPAADRSRRRPDKPGSLPIPSLAPVETGAGSQDEAPLADAGAQGLWEDSAQAAGTGQSPSHAQRTSMSPQMRRFSNLQKILIVCIVFVAVLFVYAVRRVSSGHVTDLVPPRLASAPAAEVPPPLGRALMPETEKPGPGREPGAPPPKRLPGGQRSELRRPGAVDSPEGSLSLTVAEAFYRQKDYSRAYAAYDQLRQAMAADEQDEPLEDFLTLKMAFCMKKAGNIQQANQLFKTLLQSPYPAIRALAAYHQIFVELENKQYWQARTRAYQTIALVETIDFYRDWALTLERDCHFLVAESLTRNVLSLCDADKDLPPQLWRHSRESSLRSRFGGVGSGGQESDPFINVSEAQLRSFLNSGSDRLRKALLGPQIQQLQGQSAGPCWSVSCCGAPIEELLARFAAHAGLDIQWAYRQAPATEYTTLEASGPVDGTVLRPSALLTGQVEGVSVAKPGAVRKRPVYLYLSAATPQQLVSVAAGCVGLLAQMETAAEYTDRPAGGAGSTPSEASGPVEGTVRRPSALLMGQVEGVSVAKLDQATVRILNPSDYSSLSDHLAVLCREAVSLWQRFLLTSAGDDRIANAHFALGLLKAQKGQLTDALAEYKLVANRFLQTSFAPYALLHSSRLRVNLRDFAGAREDLKQLIELYPDSEFSDQACLNLADATMKAGLFEEGARLFLKAYNLAPADAGAKIASALGAGRCFYEQKDYEAAAEWLTRFISLAVPARQDASPDFHLACLLLGKTYLARALPEQAGDALEYAVAGRLGRGEYIEAVSALVDAHAQQGHFIEAFNVLDKTGPWQFSQEESVEMLLLKTKVLRCMGLFDKAILVLGDRAEYLLDRQAKAKVLYELAKCNIAQEELGLARKNLTDVLVLIEPGPFAHEVACELADVCLKLGQNSQAVTVCRQLLDSVPSLLPSQGQGVPAEAGIRQRALDILATAHIRQRNYEGAVLALLGAESAGKEPDPNSRGRDSNMVSPPLQKQGPAEDAPQQNTTVMQRTLEPKT